MKTATSKTKKEEVALIKGNVLSASMEMDFDELYNEDAEKVNKQIKYHNNKKGKEVQLLAKINQIQMRTAKAQTDYRKSLVDPTMDSVEIAIELKALSEEQKIAESVYKQLFPNSTIGK
jgi:hypothetical protein